MVPILVPFYSILGCKHFFNREKPVVFVFNRGSKVPHLKARLRNYGLPSLVGGIVVVWWCLVLFTYYITCIQHRMGPAGFKTGFSA